MKRFFDVVSSFFALIFLGPIIFSVAVFVTLTSPGPILYWSDRIGRNNSIFKMPKFRTMDIDIPVSSVS